MGLPLIAAACAGAPMRVRVRAPLPGDGDVGEPPRNFQMRSPCAAGASWKGRRRRRDGRAAEGGGLLNRYRGSTSIGGSNPPPSAMRPGRPHPGRLAGAAKLSLEIFSGGTPGARARAAPRRGNPNPAKPLADRARPPAENFPSDHGPVYAPRANPHRSQRRRKGRGMGRRSSRADRRIGCPYPQGFRQTPCFQRLAPSRRGSRRDFRGVFGPFLSGIVRPSPG